MINVCPIRGLCLNNPTTFFSGAYLLRRIADLPLYADEGSVNPQGSTHLSNSVGRLLLAQYGRADFYCLNELQIHYYFKNLLICIINDRTGQKILTHFLRYLKKHPYDSIVIGMPIFGKGSYHMRPAQFFSEIGGDKP